jgi:hypothetical protein
VADGVAAMCEGRILPETDTQVPKAVRIVLVCDRKIAELDERITRCSCPAERSGLISERRDIRSLRELVASQEEYAAWVSRLGSPPSS